MWRERFKLLLRFMCGQTAVQLLNFVSAMLLMRLVDVDSFAQYSLAFAFQGTMASLIDVGLTGSIIALVGNRTGDPAAIGKYLRSAKFLRTVTFGCVSVLSTGLYWVVTRHHGWSTESRVLVFAAVVFGTGMQLLSVYSAPLLIGQRFKEYYLPQIASAGFRILLICVLAIAGMLNASTATWVGAGAIGLTGWGYWRLARPFVQEPVCSDMATNREVLRYVTPLMPGIVFASFQAHISVALITIFGNTRSIAEVGALGRLSQVFLLLTAMNSVLITPRIARLPHPRVFRRYIEASILQFSIACVLGFLAFRFPDLLLWILGPKYRELRADVGWVVLYSCVAYVCQGLWSMNNGRKWVFWWSSLSCIPLAIIVQVVTARFVDVSTTRGVILLNLTANSGILVLHIGTALYGYRLDSKFEVDSRAKDGFLGTAIPQNVAAEAS